VLSAGVCLSTEEIPVIRWAWFELHVITSRLCVWLVGARQSTGQLLLVSDHGLRLLAYCFFTVYFKGFYLFTYLLTYLLTSWTSLRATRRRLPYGVTQCYLQPDTSELTTPNSSQTGWYSIYLSRRGGRLSWPSWLGTYWDGLPASRQSPIQVVTGPDVEQVCWLSSTNVLTVNFLQLHFAVLK